MCSYGVVYGKYDESPVLKSSDSCVVKKKRFCWVTTRIRVFVSAFDGLARPYCVQRRLGEVKFVENMAKWVITRLVTSSSARMVRVFGPNRHNRDCSGPVRAGSYPVWRMPDAGSTTKEERDWNDIETTAENTTVLTLWSKEHWQPCNYDVRNVNNGENKEEKKTINNYGSDVIAFTNIFFCCLGIRHYVGCEYLSRKY